MVDCMTNYNFLYSQKIVVLSKNKDEVLLCRRKCEEDYDGIFSLIGGKMETRDESIVEGLKREKDEEVGENFKIKIYPSFSINLLFTKNNGKKMILPHYLAIHDSGEIKLNNEYSEYHWVDLDELEEFDPKISNITSNTRKLIRLLDIVEEDEFVLI